MRIQIKRNKQLACELTLNRIGGNEWEIAFLETQPNFRGQGLAREAMDRAEALADKNGLALIGYIDTQKDGTLGHDDMKAWLKRRGYKQTWYQFDRQWDGKTPKKRVWYRHPKNI